MKSNQIFHIDSRMNISKTILQNLKFYQFQATRQAQWPRGSELDLWSSACIGAEVRFPLPALNLLQSLG